RRHTRFSRDWSSDVCSSDLRPDKLDKHLFLREARAISQLKHRNICTVYDVDEDDGRPYMVMELIEGPKLSERLSKERLPASEAEIGRASCRERVEVWGVDGA